MNAADRSAVTDSASVQGVEHEASKSGIRLFLWEKFVDSPAGKPAVLSVLKSAMATGTTTAELEHAVTKFCKGVEREACLQNAEP